MSPHTNLFSGAYYLFEKINNNINHITKIQLTVHLCWLRLYILLYDNVGYIMLIQLNNVFKREVLQNPPVFCLLNITTSGLICSGQCISYIIISNCKVYLQRCFSLLKKSLFVVLFADEINFKRI